MGKREILIFDDQTELAEVALKKWKELSRKTVSKQGIFTAALSGGKSPVEFFRKLGKDKELPWNKTHIFLVDERFVPFDHQDSNYRLIKENLLDRIPPENFHPIPTGVLSPEISVEKYRQSLQVFFKLEPGEFPVFDLILLGIGVDGHTASLFPGSKILLEKSAAVIRDENRKVKHPRISLSLPVLNHAREIIFLVSGESKADILKEILQFKKQNLPASLVKPEKGKLTFLLDRDAAAGLTGKIQE